MIKIRHFSGSKARSFSWIWGVLVWPWHWLGLARPWSWSCSCLVLNAHLYWSWIHLHIHTVHYHSKVWGRKIFLVHHGCIYLIKAIFVPHPACLALMTLYHQPLFTFILWKRMTCIPHNFSFCIPQKKERHMCWFENDQMLLLILLNSSMSKTLGACGLPMRVPTLRWCPPNSRKVVVGQQLLLLPAAPHWHAHLPMVPGAMPSTLTLPRHWHAEPFLEARRDRLASLLFPQGVAFSPATVEWNKAVGDEREQPTQLLGGKGCAVSFYDMLPWLASSFSIIISIICYDTSCGLLIKCSFSFLFSVTSAGLQSLIRSIFQQLSAQTHLKQMEGAGNDG